MQFLAVVLKDHPPLRHWLMAPSSCATGADSTASQAPPMPPAPLHSTSRTQPVSAEQAQPRSRPKPKPTHLAAAPAPAHGPLRPALRQCTQAPSSAGTAHGLREESKAQGATPPVGSPAARDRTPPHELAQPAPAPLPRSIQVTFTTSCVLMPPKAQWARFIAIKRNHMKPSIKRPPYPHVTLVAPFVPPAHLPAAAALLRAALQGVEPFSLRFASFELFDNRSNSTLYLPPEESRPGALRALRDTCVALVPDTPAAAAAREKAFEAHLGVGFFPDRARARACQAAYQAEWEPIDYVVREVYFVARPAQDAPWEVRAVVPLGRAPGAPVIAVGETTRL